MARRATAWLRLLLRFAVDAIVAQRGGYYVVARLDIEPSTLTEFERRIKLEDRILRYLIVVDEGFKPLLSPAEAEAASEVSAEKPHAAKAKSDDAEAKPAAAVAKENE